MSDDLIRAAEAEERTLLSELAEHPTFQKLEAVRALLVVYRGRRAERPLSAALINSGSFGMAAKMWSPPRTNSVPSQIIDAAAKFLRQRAGRRAQVSELMDAIRAAGVPIRHEKPLQYVSGVLSHSPLFDNIRGQGYGLIEWQTKPSDQNAGTNLEPGPSSTLEVPSDVVHQEQLEEVLP